MLILFNVSNILFGQITIKGKIVDSLTNKPLSEIFFYILKDTDIKVNCGKSNSSGDFVGLIEQSEYDAQSTYQISINEKQYSRIMVNIIPHATDSIVIKLNKDKYYFPYPKIYGMMYKDSYCCPMLGDYEPKIIRYDKDLPATIKEKVANHLKERVGGDFYAKLRISDGIIVDLDRLLIVEDYLNTYHWTPQSYYLSISFMDTTNGIACFSAKMVLDKEGNIIEEINLPNIQQDISKGEIMSMAEAIEVAKCNNYYNEKTYIDFEYDENNDCFTWIFTEPIYNDKFTSSYKRFRIAAHNGKMLKRKDGDRIRYWFD